MEDMIGIPIRVPISRLCTVERAINGKTYPKGTCYVTLSAAHDTVMQLAENGPIESRYAALTPLENVDGDYLKIVLDRAFPRWLMAHRTGINLQFAELSTLTVEWHERKKDRRAVVENTRMVDKLLANESQTIDELKKLKSFALIRMFK